MQLDTKSPSEIHTVQGILGAANRLVRFIDSPMCFNSSGVKFEDVLGSCAKLFPRCAAAFGGCQLRLMSPEARRDLKLELLEDVKACMADASDELYSDKMLGEIQLPSDPDECLVRLNELVLELMAKIAEINKLISAIPLGRIVLHRMRENKQFIESFNDEHFKTMPSAVVARKAKKPRNG